MGSYLIHVYWLHLHLYLYLQNDWMSRKKLNAHIIDVRRFNHFQFLETDSDFSFKFQCDTCRKLRGDLIETYKLLTNKEDIDSQQFFQLTEDPYQLRGNNRRIYKVRCRGEIRRNFFSQRVVDHWKNLP